MKHLLFLSLLGLATFHGHRGALTQASSYGERGSDLGIQVFQQEVRSRPLENIVLSPHGVASILGMLLPGAHGETRKQLFTALRYKKNGAGIPPAATRAELLAQVNMNLLGFRRAVQDAEEAPQDADGQGQPGLGADRQRPVQQGGLPHGGGLRGHQQSQLPV